MAILNRSWFFTPTINQERFLSQDEPTEQVMRNFADSVAMKLEASDTATEIQQGLVEMATQAEFDAGTDVNSNMWALYVRPSMIKAGIDAASAALQAQIDAILINISTIEADITALQSDVADIQTDITNINTTIGDSMPLGSIMMYPVAAPPNAKWLVCEGQSVAVAAYPDLHAIIGYTFGGAGANFNLPDMRSKFVAGYDATGAPEYGTIGQGAGENEHLLTAAESGEPGHNHTINETTTGAHSHDVTINVRDGGTSGIAGLIGRNSNDGTITITGVADGEGRVVSTEGNHNHSVSANAVPAADAAQPHENRPEFIVFPYMIKALN